jgi:ATP-dependent Lhr-like helicase
MPGASTRDDAVFASLAEPVREALSERGFSTPTEPQRLAIPPIVDGEHTLVVAPTGTGKTETAVLPVFDSLVRAEHAFGIRALYVTPLRALNRDMRERLESWGETLGLTVDVRHGDTTDYQRRKQAENPPDVLVTTPETLQAMFTGSKLRRALEDVAHVVVDEIHELAASKRGAQFAVALERLRELAGPMQRVGLSATVGEPETIGAFLTGGRDCAVRSVDVGSRLELSVKSPSITAEDESLAGELLVDETTASHVRCIRDLVAAHDSTLIFVNTRQTAEALGSRFKRLESVDIGVHHGSLATATRIDIEQAFKDGQLDGLLCTSSMELGIDVGHVDHVVQYQSPRQVKRLLQRVGRAGHRRELVSSGTVLSTRPDDTIEATTIARRALDGQVEPAPIHEGSLDVLANQLVGLAYGRDEIDARRAFELVRRAYPFHDLDAETVRSVVRELAGNRVIWLDEDEDRIESTGGTWQYVYNNLSMIPDESTYEVYDVASGEGIGTLDERFVVTFAEPGAVFIQRGEMWRITDVDGEDERVTVSPIEDPAGEVPSWIGQEIPVPRSVATEVGEIRGVAGEQLDAEAPVERVAADLAGRYPADAETLSSALDQFDRHAETGTPFPTDQRLLLEQSGRTIVVNAPFGHAVNETLGRLLSALLGQQTGSSVAMEVDPYRIELETPRGIGTPDVRELLLETEPDHVGPLIELSLTGSDALAFRLSQVAAQFAAIKPWQGNDGLSGDRLLKALEDTPVHDEAIREVFHEDLDVEGAGDVLEAIQAGDLTIEIARQHTPIGSGGRSSGRELLAPENADASVIDAVKDRLQDDRITLFCLHCTDYERTKPVRRVRDQPRCPACESTQIAAINAYDEETIPAVRTDEKDDDQQKRTERAYRAASLVQAHGEQAVIALAARGVGPHNAARIINKLRENERAFYRDILEQEREYARTQSFWD